VIYPNPANTTLYFSGVQANAQISVYDINGKMLINTQIFGNKLDISRLANGFYAIKITEKSGIVTKKFVKQ